VDVAAAATAAGCVCVGLAFWFFSVLFAPVRFLLAVMPAASAIQFYTAGFCSVAKLICSIVGSIDSS
jgi:hypothetical protein